MPALNNQILFFHLRCDALAAAAGVQASHKPVLRTCCRLTPVMYFLFIFIYFSLFSLFFYSSPKLTFFLIV